MPYDEDFYNSALEVEPYYTLEDVVARAADHFPAAWKKYWGIGAPHAPDHLDPDVWETANELHDVASKVYRAATSLLGERFPESLRELPSVLQEEARDDKLSRDRRADELQERAFEEARSGENWDALAKLLEESRRLRLEEGEAEKRVKLFHSALQMYAYPEFGSPPAQVASRLLDLLEFIVHSKGERTRQYLSRVAACYVGGMQAELAVMARAVMEAALEDLPSIQRRLTREGKERHASLADSLAAAIADGVLDPEGCRAADRIRNAGNKAIHRVPEQVPEARAVLADLRLVLSQLERFANNHD